MSKAKHAQVDRYEIRRGLGRGAMGSVYLAWDPKVGREVAIKVLQREFAQKEKYRQRFEREAKAIAALKHPNIVEIYDYGGSPDDHLYLVMEYIKGQHVGKLCRDVGVFPESVLVALGLELGSALMEAHQNGIIHRDLKPENVFLERGRVILADFGIAKAVRESTPLGEEAAANTTDIMGTPGFMAPEQLARDRLDGRTDIFSFGALLYFLATKQLAFAAESPYGLARLFRETKPVPLHELRPEISERFSELVQDCLEAVPGARPSGIEVVRKRLTDILERLGAREPRELLAAFEQNPNVFRVDDRTRTIRHLMERLKIAARDQDGVEADLVRHRLAVLDPDNDEALRISGVEQLWRRGVPVDPMQPTPVKSKRWPVASALTLVVLLGVFAGLYTARDRLPTLAPKPRAQKNVPVPKIAEIHVRARDRTHVFQDGRLLGTTPEFPAVMVAAGPVELEFVHASKGRLRRGAYLNPGESVTFVVEWRKMRVRVVSTKDLETVRSKS